MNEKFRIRASYSSSIDRSYLNCSSSIEAATQRCEVEIRVDSAIKAARLKSSLVLQSPPTRTNLSSPRRRTLYC